MYNQVVFHGKTSVLQVCTYSVCLWPDHLFDSIFMRNSSPNISIAFGSNYLFRLLIYIILCQLHPWLLFISACIKYLKQLIFVVSRCGQYSNLFLLTVLTLTVLLFRRCNTSTFVSSTVLTSFGVCLHLESYNFLHNAAEIF